MDPLQQKALNALEPYILLSKNATSPRAAIDLVTQATSALNTYVFTELLQTPNIQALRNASPDHASYLTLLEIFAWGTWSDYEATPNLPPLSEAQSHKLRQLSLLSISTSPAALGYPHLLIALSLPSIRALEDLIISSIYAGLLSAKLDTLQKRMDVSSVAPLRDLRPNSVPQMVTVLEDWNARCVGVLAEIEAQVADVRRKAQEARKREVENERALERALEDSWRDKGKAGGKRGAKDVVGGDGGGTAEAGEEMDVDEAAPGKMRTRATKRGGGRLVGLAKRFGG